MVRINSSHSQPGEMPKLPCKVATIIMNIADIYVHIIPYRFCCLFFHSRQAVQCKQEGSLVLGETNLHSCLKACCCRFPNPGLCQSIKIAGYLIGGLFLGLILLRHSSADIIVSWQQCMQKLLQKELCPTVRSTSNWILLLLLLLGS